MISIPGMRGDHVSIARAGQDRLVKSQEYSATRREADRFVATMHESRQIHFRHMATTRIIRAITKSQPVRPASTIIYL